MAGFRAIAFCISIILTLNLVLQEEVNGAARLNCSVSFTQGVSVSTNTIYIPFQLVGRLIAVEASIDTVSGLFFFDTGASDLLLNERYFESDNTIAGATAAGATGIIGEVGRAMVDTLQWDLLEIRNLDGHIVSLSHLEDKKRVRLVGILGYAVFKDFEVLIDYSIRQMILTRVDRNGRRYDREAIFQIPVDSLDFRLVGHVITLRGTVNGVRMKFGLDTGAELNLLDIGVRRRALDKFELLRRVTMTGAGSDEIEVLAGILYEVDVGIEQRAGMRTLLTRMWKVNDALRTDLDGILGYEFLFNKRTLINFQKQKLYFFEPVNP